MYNVARIITLMIAVHSSVREKDIKKVFFASTIAALIFGIFTDQIILSFVLLCLALPLAILLSLSFTQDTQKAAPERSPKLDIVWCGALMGIGTTANYLWFFERHGMNLSNTPVGTPLHIKSLTLAFFTLFLCLVVYLLQRKYSEGVFSRSVLTKRSIWLKVLLVTAIIAACLYWPFIAGYSYVDALGLYDWFTVLLTGLLYLLIREIQRWDQQHHRHAVHSFHEALEQTRKL